MLIGPATGWPGPADPKVKILTNTWIRAILIDINNIILYNFTKFRALQAFLELFL